MLHYHGVHYITICYSTLHVICVISQAGGGGGATAKLQEPGGGHIQGKDDFRQSRRGGGLLYHDKLLVFPQNASP